ncbi:hypothetical protein V8E54_003300 [Elaphomyces granulatus]
MAKADRRLRCEDYTIGWVCALLVELAAAQEMLDAEHENPHHDANDTNLYTLGRIGEHNVIIASLPKGQHGTNSAAAVAAHMKSAFTSIRFCLMVGIGGGVPSEQADIQLGDVVVGTPHKVHSGVVQYDIGKATPSGFERTGFLNTPPTILLNAIVKLQASHARGISRLSENVSKFDCLPTFARTSVGPDILFQADYNHEGGATCERCSTGRSVNRPLRCQEVLIHYGTIASGNQVMREAAKRDRISAELGGVLCFEMEAAGLMNSFPCLVIRGICDYADSHKNKKWQPYAAATASAYAKELLSIIAAVEVAETRTVCGFPNDGGIPPLSRLIYNNVPRRAVTHFVPRVEAQKLLEDWLRNESPSQMFVLQGMGGSGKTQLAFRCCQMAQESGFLATFWINASSPFTVQQSYRSILHMISPGNEEGGPAGGCLFSITNAFTSQSIRDYIPGQGGHILFTSRHKDSSRLGHYVDLSRMTDEEGTKLLLQATSISENSEVAEIVFILCSLALALDQAGAYIRAHGLPLSQFVSHYKKRKRIVLEEVPDEWEYRNAQDLDNMRSLSALTTWEMSLDLIKGTSQKEKDQKVDFLTLASFLDPYQISERYFRVYNTVNNSNWMELLRNSGKWDTDKLGDLLGEFQRLSLIQSFERREDGHVFSMHPLICDWMKFRKDTDATLKVIELTNMLGAFLGTHDVNYLPLEVNQETTRHANAWVEANESILHDSYKTTLTVHGESIGLFANLYCSQGLYEEAEQLYGRALEGWEEKLGPTHPETLRTAQNLALVYRNQGRYDEAAQLYGRALEGREEMLGPKYPDTLMTVGNLAIVYSNQARYEDAEQLYGRALQGREEKLGLKHPDTLMTVQNLANVYRDQGRYKEAEELFGRALEGWEEKLGPKHPDTLRTVQNLALVYWNQGRYEEAEQLYGRALQGREEKLGPKHPDTLMTVQNLANVYRDQGQYEEAEELFGRALEGWEEKLGPTHPDTLRTVQNLALVYWNQARYDEAEQLYGRSLEGWEEKLGPKHPDTLRTVRNLALVYWNQGRYEEAEQLYGRAREGWEEKLGPKHPETLMAVGNLALVYWSQGRYEEAEQLYGRVLEGWEEKLGPKHPDTLRTVQNLANVYRDQTRYEEAEQLHRRALEGREEKLGPKQPDTLETVDGLANVYRNKGQYEKAEQLYGRALEGRKKTLGPKHPDTLETVDGLANVYRNQGRYEGAKQLYGRALEGREEKLGPKHPDTLRTVHGLAEVYRDQGRYEEAEQLYGRVLEGREEKLGPKHPETLRTVHGLANVYRDQWGTEEKLGLKQHPDTLQIVEGLPSPGSGRA